MSEMANAEGTPIRDVGAMYFVPVAGAAFDVTDEVVIAWDAEGTDRTAAVVSSPLWDRLAMVPVCH
jgi:hypothetical protein